MSEYLGIFLENIVPRNLVLMHFLGILISIAETKGVRTSLIKGVKFSLGLFFATVIGVVIASSLPLELEFFHPWIFLLTALGIIFILQYTGELTGDFYGMPKLFLPLVPIVGLQYLLFQRGLNFEIMMISAIANAIGFYFGYILIATIKEQIIISEANDIFKYTPTLLISLGVLSMAAMGFAFIY